ncbi:MAG TPA: hypothetical protein VJR92_12185 [Gemmatimonadaceae bacterium]|nr:hypothetical protein [Gemmatimonadaceae bacterium]
MSDLAGTSLKLRGAYRWAQFNAGGLCSFAMTAGDDFNSLCGGGAYFHYLVAWGVPPHEYAKIRNAWPGVANMQPPVGYSTPWRITSIAPRVERIGPADDQFGSMFSGLTALDGAGCRDMSGALGASLPPSFVLSAASDCPETWGTRGFDGIRSIPDSVWLARFRENPSAFRWDDWKIPSDVAGERVLGDLATYGMFADFNREILARYGSVTPRGGPNDGPTERGFPVGIEVRYDVFKFDRRSLREGVFVRWLVINSSAKVWGQGIEYDSLYMGVDPGYIRQTRAVYNLPGSGIHVLAPGGLSGRCTAAYPRRIPPGVQEACANTGFGFDLTMVLKSPIGDLRNKLFSQPASPYFAPGHSKADDTITFNHWRKGGFGAQEQLSWRRNDRSLFGLFSGKEDLWLDGRAVTELSAAQIWNLFRYEFTDGTQSLANLRYTRSVPGSVPGYGLWDYNDDGVQDTLMVPNCGASGCAAAFSDTIAGGFGATLAGNMSNFLGVGPFALKAGDTTEFIWFVGRPTDTLSYKALVSAVTESYLSNFRDAQPIELPAFTASDVYVTAAAKRDTGQKANVRIQLRMPSRGNDAFIERALSQLESSDPTAVELRRLNPGLTDSVRARMQRNLARVLVFKSCDRGRTWTDATGACESAAASRTQTVEGATLGVGWKAFRVLTANGTGALSSHVVSDDVLAGREYLYSFVSQTRGLSDIRVVISETVDGGGVVTNRTMGSLWDAMFIDVDTVTSTLTAGGPTTVLVYAPVALPAGTVAAHVDTATRQGTATNAVTAVVRSAAVDGLHRMRFGNRFVIVRSIDTATGIRSNTIVRQSVYRAYGSTPTAYSPTGANGGAAFSPAGPRLQSPGAVNSFHFVASADTFISNRDFTYSVRRNADGSIHPSRELSVVPVLVSGSTKLFIDTIDAAGYVVAKAASGGEPFFLSLGNGARATNFTTIGGVDSGLVQSTDLHEGASWYPGFTATVATESFAPAPRRAALVRGGSDTVRSPSSDTAGVRLNAGLSAIIGDARRGGTYRLAWAGDAFGPSAPFDLEPKFLLQPKLDASLAARPVGQLTDATVTALVGGGPRPLIVARLPFLVIGSNDEVVRVAMRQRHVTGNVADSLLRNSILLGTAGDTTRVSIPPNVWMPGDDLMIVERISTDSTATVSGASGVVIVRDTIINGEIQQLPIRTSREVFSATFALRCPNTPSPTRTTCNPIRPGSRGATAYTAYKAGWTSVIEFTRAFDQNSEVTLNATPTIAGAVPLTKRDMNQIHVVPNPFVVQSAFDRAQTSGAVQSRVLFVNVPKEGVLRVYTVSGQMVQQLSWTASDLTVAGDNSPHGDLPYNLRTREGRDLAAGLYLYVITARGAGANGAVARGKFVVIR